MAAGRMRGEGEQMDDLEWKTDDRRTWTFESRYPWDPDHPPHDQTIRNVIVTPRADNVVVQVTLWGGNGYVTQFDYGMTAREGTAAELAEPKPDLR
jgi:hypothetical protein